MAFRIAMLQVAQRHQQGFVLSPWLFSAFLAAAIHLERYMLVGNDIGGKRRAVGTRVVGGVRHALR